MAARAARKSTRSGNAPPRRAKRSKRGKSRVPSIVSFDIGTYGGKWVATRRGHIIASAKEFAEIRRLVRGMGCEEDAVLTRVPETGEFAY